MTRPATLYARAHDARPASLSMGAPGRQTPAWRYDPTRPDGRWTRVLRACRETPLSINDINRAVRKFGPDRNSHAEKARTWRAVRNLVRLGLMMRDADRRYVATGAGLSALAEAREAA